ncbi:maleate cis-trans isomerase family protein [Microvirga massiliensis]|uniref:maleate cis-trans isomerase family protein n=1 Tax=Microvirga massiliensis TaxID=1033741 RepID=UPI00062B7B8A|nr:aspartate/glutamate racemase family protein [Microvirga massiliensis]
MARRIRIGMLTPSSNTVLEPVTARILADSEGYTAHFSRFRVTEIALHGAALSQFDLTPMLDAARLLRDAKVDAIAWNGTSASWLGLEADRRLCDTIQSEIGVPASTCVLSLVEVLRQSGAQRYGLVTPYTEDVQAKIISNFRSEGLECAAERHLGIRDNFAFGETKPSVIGNLIREVAVAGPDAIIVLCTNLAGAFVADQLAAALEIPIHDSVAITLWGALRAAGLDVPADITSATQLTHFLAESVDRDIAAEHGISG